MFGVRLWIDDEASLLLFIVRPTEILICSLSISVSGKWVTGSLYWLVSVHYSVERHYIQKDGAG